MKTTSTAFLSLYHPHGLRAKLIPRINKMAAALLAGLITATAALSSAQAQGHKTNTSAGLEAGANVTSGKKNTANGAYALQKNKAGNNNTAVGNQALKLNQAGSKNTAVGNQALKKKHRIEQRRDRQCGAEEKHKRAVQPRHRCRSPLGQRDRQ